MIVLDTNVLSELIKPAPAPQVIAWASRQSWQDITTTTICEAELCFGVALLPDGRRREKLARAIVALFDTMLAGRVLDFDRRAARLYGPLCAARRRLGLEIRYADMQIAAIAKGHRADAVATRNVADYVGTDVTIIDPWSVG